MTNKYRKDAHTENLINIELGDSMDFTGLKVLKLRENEVIADKVKTNQEMCFVLLTGYGDLKLNGDSHDNIGNRMSVFDDAVAYAAYVCADDSYSFTATTECEIALCFGHNKVHYKTRILEPKEQYIEHRGVGQNKRTAKNILPESDDAHSLLIVEVITRGGNWSSFPSHRHDEDNIPIQSYLEEIYYHKLNPEVGGFAFQRIYNDDKSLDVAYSIEDGDAVTLKEGYHPVSVPPGYDLYYLNVMAGPKRVWKFYNDPYFEQLLEKEI